MLIKQYEILFPRRLHDILDSRTNQLGDLFAPNQNCYASGV